MSTLFEFVDFNNLPQRTLPNLQDIDFLYNSHFRQFHFQPYPTDCNIILCDETGIHALGITIDETGEAVCPLDEFLAISPSAGAFWLHRGSLNQWRLLAWWGDPAQLPLHEDMPVIDYPTALKITF